MPWAGAAMAALLWGGIGAWMLAAVGPAVLFSQPPLVWAGGLAAIIAPGIALIAAGIMARESARSAEANAIVLTSARLLLEPAETARDEIAAIGEAVTRETQNAQRALVDIRTRFDGLRKDIETSVSTALKAAEIVRADSEVLVGKMASERQSMTQLAESLRLQTESLSKAIPRHAQMIADAARGAQEQVKGADETMRARLSGIEETAAKLAQRIGQLDTMGAESRKRAQNLAGALMRLDEQLVQSTRMVEAATKAGELATAATKSTAESLRDSVSDALNSALKATETINERSSQAAEGAREAMLRLKEAGLQAEAATRAAALAAKTHVQETEQRVSQMSDLIFNASAKAASIAEGNLERLQHRMEKASLLISQMKDEKHSTTIDDLVMTQQHQPAPPAPSRAPSREPSRSPAELFMSRKPEPVRAPEPREEPVFAREPAREPEEELVLRKEPAPASDDLVLDRRAIDEPILRTVPQRPLPGELRPMSLSDPRSFAETKTAAPANGNRDEELVLHQVEGPRRPASQPPAPHDAFFAAEQPKPEPAMSWRDLLNGIDETSNGRRDEGGHVIDRLDRAGVRLGAVKASDLRRIASAAHQGERQRRRAIRDVAPSEIQRVSRLLDTDRDLQMAARSFVNAEEPDALRQLAMPERMREDATQRLSAFLLLDAALGAT
ncbi:MAG TPA: hypothetical protein VIA80_16870 [Hyphomonadaceae bacterium]|jgi:hypothetical protein